MSNGSQEYASYVRALVSIGDPGAKDRVLALDENFNEKQVIHLLKICHGMQSITLRNVRITDSVALVLALKLCRSENSIKSLFVNSSVVESKRGLFLILNALEGTDCSAEMSMKLEFECDRDTVKTISMQNNCKLTILNNDDIASKALLIR